MLSYPFFSSNEAKNIFFNEPNILVQIAFWTKKGYIQKIKKGLYVLTNAQGEIDPATLASKMYAPSYLSLEFALNCYGIIPDIPGTHTSVTSRKTMRHKNQFGNFSFRKIKKEFFTGYVAMRDKNISYNMATPEKALMDFIYFGQSRFEPKEDFWREMRIDEDFRLDRKKIEEYKKLFKNNKINELADSLLRYQKNAR